MKAIFAAGGTAGHINPALAIADKLKSVFPDRYSTGNGGAPCDQGRL